MIRCSRRRSPELVHRRALRAGLTLALAVVATALAGAASLAQPGANAPAGDKVAKIARLGSPATCVTPPMKDVAALKKAFAVKRNQQAISRILDKAGLASITPQVMEAISTGAVESTSFAPGGTLVWMGLRKGGKPDIVSNAVWAGKEPFDGFQFVVDDMDRTYTFIVPKACGNLALISAEPSKKMAAQDAAKAAEEARQRAEEARKAAGPAVGQAPAPVDSGTRAREAAQFPWPVPRPTHKIQVNRRLFSDGGTRTLGDVADRLERAMDHAGYVERSFYLVPGGFAVATHLEQIEDDGTPKPASDRFSRTYSMRPFSITGIVRELVTAPPGHWRVVVFVVTSETLEVSGTSPSAPEVEEFVRGGSQWLPPATRRQPFLQETRVAALIYEFAKRRYEERFAFLPDSDVTADAHLVKAKLMEGLRQ